MLCGAIATYNATEQPPGPRNYLNLLLQRGRMEGFLVGDYLRRAAEAIAALAAWLQEGKIRNQVDVQHGRRMRLRRCGGCSRAATRASSSCASPNRWSRGRPPSLRRFRKLNRSAFC